jgi:hypothetical protein
MFPDKEKCMVVIDHLKMVFPEAGIDYKADTDTFTYIFRIEHGTALQFLKMERSFVDDRTSSDISNYLDSIDIKILFRKPNIKSIYISNRGYGIGKS